MRALRLLVPSFLLFVASTIGPAPAWSDDSESEEEQDHERAREAVERGEALPLDRVLDAVRLQVDGQIIGVEFEKEDGQWVYEIRVVDPGGRVIEVLADARTARIVNVEGD